MRTQWGKPDREYVPPGYLKIEVLWIRVYDNSLAILDFLTQGIKPNPKLRQAKEKKLKVIVRVLHKNRKNGALFVKFPKPVRFQNGFGGYHEKTKFWVLGKDGHFGCLDTGRGNPDYHRKFLNPEFDDVLIDKIRKNKVGAVFCGMKDRTSWRDAS